VGNRLRTSSVGVGILLQVVLWLGGTAIHCLAAYIVYLKHGFILGFISLGFPFIATLWALWSTTSSGIWWYANTVIVYIATLITSWLLIAYGIRGYAEQDNADTVDIPATSYSIDEGESGADAKGRIGAGDEGDR